MRGALEREGMLQPDEVEHDGDEVVFLWHEHKVAIVVGPDDVYRRPYGQ